MSERSTYIKFKGGHHPLIHGFYQRDTYYGLLEGVPDTEINASYIQSFQVEAKRKFSLENIHLINPKQLIMRPDSPTHMDSKGQNVYKASLPKVVCMIELSSDPVHDQSKEWSRLGLIWFQNHYAFPISEDVQNQIELLDWDNLSVDAYY